MDACTATDHYNDHHSDQKNPPTPPNKPANPQLPEFVCLGVCGNTYTTVGEALSDHYAKCGTGADVDTFQNPDIELASRTVSEGCGREWYTCEQKTALHEERTCNRWFYQRDDQYGSPLEKERCRIPYRRCLKKTFNHNPDVLGKIEHSDEIDSTEQQFIVPDPQTIPTTPSLITCDIQDCTIITPYDPNDAAAASLHEYCNGCYQYKCNGRTHVEEQCTITNANGNRCTYTFWRCVHPNVPFYGPSHVHQY